MKQGEATVKKLARLLETAAKKHNESADATCSVAECFERPDCDLSDETFDTVFDSVTELARVLLDKKPDYRRAARAARKGSQGLKEWLGQNASGSRAPSS